MLIENGADVTVVNQDGWTALHVASRTDDVEKARLLLDASFGSLFVCGKNGRSIMHSICLKLSSKMLQLGFSFFFFKFRNRAFVVRFKDKIVDY